MAGFWWLYTICDPNDGPAMIAWLLAFLGFPPPLGIPGSLKGLFSLPFRIGSTAPLPARTCAYSCTTQTTMSIDICLSYFKAQHSGHARRSKASGCEVIFKICHPERSASRTPEQSCCWARSRGTPKVYPEPCHFKEFFPCSAPGKAFSVPNVRSGLASADSSSQSKLSSWIDASA